MVKKNISKFGKKKETETREKIQKELMLQKRIPNRKVNAKKETSLDDLFDSIPSKEKKHIISSNPLLKYEYRINGRRYFTLYLITKKFSCYKQIFVSKLNKQKYLRIIQTIRLYDDLIFKRLLTYENILDDLNAYKQLSNFLNCFFNDNNLLNKKFILEVKKFYTERLPILIIINKINKEQLYNKKQLSKLVKQYQCKILEFMSGQNDNILDIINQEIKTNNKRM